MKRLITNILIAVMAAGPAISTAQMKITGGNDHVIDSNAILELESDSLGFLPPRIAINDLNSAYPLLVPVTVGMTVFSDGGTVPDGYYYWDGNKWQRLVDPEYSLVPVTKTASDTLLKSERMVLGSNDITLTLPDITPEDNGLSITVKNIGDYTDLVIVKAYSGITIDGTNDSRLTRWRAETFTAFDGEWIIRERIPRLNKRLDVSPKSSWTSPEEVIAYLNEHMTAPMIVQFCGGSYEISETIQIDLPYPVTFQGLSFGETYFEAAEGLAGKPMFRCLSECYFKMLVFDGSTLENYGTQDGEDAIRYVGEETYHEIKDAYFLQFNKGVVDSSNTELWILDVDFEDISNSAIEITGAGIGATFKISESDFIGCARGIEMEKATDAVVSVINCGFYLAQSTDSAIVYRPAGFDFTNIAITGNTWNNTGKFITGFDFTRTDGRDANAEIMNNIGIENKNPHCKLNVVDNTSNVTCSVANSWYKLNWTNTSTYACKWRIENNKITYQPGNSRDVVIHISGNIQANNANRSLTVAIVKNGVTSSPIGATTLRITTANQPFQFSTVIYLEDVTQNNYLELFVSSLNAGDVVRVQDINWFVNSQ